MSEQQGGPEPSSPYPPYGQQPQQPQQPQPQPYAPPPFPAQSAPGYGVVLPGAKLPGQVDPETGLVFSDKERLTAGLLQLLPCVLGIPGIGRLYTGHMGIGLTQLIGGVVGLVLSCILIGLPLWIGMIIWGVVDGILMFTNKRFTDAQGRVLR